MTPTALTVDRVKRRDTKAQRAAFSRVRLAERSYATKLRRIAQHVGELVSGLLADDGELDLTEVEAALAAYAKLLTPWARRAARRTILEVARRDEVAWERYARHLGVELRAQLATAPLGAAVARLQEEQVQLITSLPLEASRRVQELARGTLYTSARPRELTREILRTGEVTKSRATLIARTETAKAASVLTRARATHVGSEGYVWRTAHDADVRESHRHMEGTFVRWDQPPEVEPGRFYHAGEFCNCFTGNTLVSTEHGVASVLRARYRGPLLLLTVGDAVIEVTPNHPVLGRRGWVAAESLQEGDEVLQVLHQRAQVPSQHHVDHRLIAFDELFEAVRPHGHRSALIVDLHGDRVVDDEVEIVGAPGHLALDGDPALHQRVRDHVIARSDRRVGRVRVENSELQVAESSSASLREVGSFLLGRSLGRQQAVRRRLPPRLVTGQLDELANVAVTDLELVTEAQAALAREVALDDRRHGRGREVRSPRCPSSTPDDAADEAARELELAAQLWDRCPSEVSFIQSLPVIRREVVSFDGHVYTLQSTTGYYAVGSVEVAAKNCRCFAEPVLPED